MAEFLYFTMVNALHRTLSAPPAREAQRDDGDGDGDGGGGDDEGGMAAPTRKEEPSLPCRLT